MMVAYALVIKKKESVEASGIMLLEEMEIFLQRLSDSSLANENTMMREGCKERVFLRLGDAETERLRWGGRKATALLNE